jgi:hypothetical protein
VTKKQESWRVYIDIEAANIEYNSTKENIDSFDYENNLTSSNFFIAIIPFYI